jgi:ABC-type transport system substrate-binding protein
MKQGDKEMALKLRAVAAASALLIAISGGGAAFAQKPGGILRVHVNDSPPSMSMHEEAAPEPARVTMGLFNNLVMFDQHAKQNSMQSIVPDLATGWSWSGEETKLTFQLRQGVKWHDGKPFTAKDVKCTWDLLTARRESSVLVHSFLASGGARPQGRSGRGESSSGGVAQTETGDEFAGATACRCPLACQPALLGSTGKDT